MKKSMFDKIKKLKKKVQKGIASEYLPWILIALLVLVIVFFAIVKYSGDGFNLIDKIKDMFRRT